MTDQDKDKRIEELTDMLSMANKIIHNQVVANQAAWIEWQRGKGAEAAMKWIHNGLIGPGNIPDENEQYASDPQLYYNKNCADPLPQCWCGKPSSIGTNGHGFCSREHLKEFEHGGNKKH